jgi:hypothetical protein
MHSISDVIQAATKLRRPYSPRMRVRSIASCQEIRWKDAFMRTLKAALAVVALMSSVPAAHARAGRTTADDCKAGSDDPDCPDAAPPAKPGQPPAKPGDPPPPPPKS